jgi:hypothetical protein
MPAIMLPALLLSFYAPPLVLLEGGLNLNVRYTKGLQNSCIYSFCPIGIYEGIMAVLT